MNYSLGKRAITDTEKEAIINRLLVLWKEYPELRLGQLILNTYRHDFYYMEDYPFIEGLEKSYGQTVDTREE